MKRKDEIKSAYKNIKADGFYDGMMMGYNIDSDGDEDRVADDPGGCLGIPVSGI